MATTARNVLYGSADEGKADLSRQLSGAPILEQASHFLPVDDLLSSLLDSLDIPLKDVAFTAWDRHLAVEKAKADTQGKPGVSETVRLAQHVITSVHEPHVDVEVGGLTTVKVLLLLTLKLTIDTVVIRVTEGRIEEIGPANAVVGATLAVDGKTVVTKDLVKTELPRYLWTAFWTKPEDLTEPLRPETNDFSQIPSDVPPLGPADLSMLDTPH